MTITKFKETLRLNRGRLTKFDKQMEYIYNNGSLSFVYWILQSKKIGIEKAVDYVDKLTKTEQDELVEFSATTSIPVASIDLKVQKIISER